MFLTTDLSRLSPENFPNIWTYTLYAFVAPPYVVVINSGGDRD